MKKKAKIIALYLPQYHPTNNNNIWWGKGFTEWTNVCKARPLFKGHYQPHIPADLGFYDLRLPQSRLAQADMAHEYGIDGFCYYHYWFDNNRQELELPFNDVLKMGEPNFPFMLCWANESWHAKFWRYDGRIDKKLLVEQKYGSEEDYTLHFFHLLEAFKDDRYLKKEGRPLFMIYRPLDFPSVSQFIKLWQKLAKENGLEGIYFIGQTINIETEGSRIIDLGFDAVNAVRHHDIVRKRPFIAKAFQKIVRMVIASPLRFSYKKHYMELVGTQEQEENIIPTILPNWDHTPRSGKAGYVLMDSTPKYFGKHLEQVFNILKQKEDNEPIAFIKSWNEWGEGNHMEPDLRYGKGYLEVFRNLRNNFGL